MVSIVICHTIKYTDISQIVIFLLSFFLLLIEIHTNNKNNLVDDVIDLLSRDARRFRSLDSRRRGSNSRCSELAAVIS